MKFRELKETYKHKFSIRVIAGVLCIALAGGSIGAYQIQAGVVKNEKADVAQKDSEESGETGSLAGKLVSVVGSAPEAVQSLDGKEETIYLISDADGTVNQTIVSSWLKNGSKKAQLQDISELSDIENVKGEESFTQNGKRITWQADGNDIYYRGTTDKQMPVTQKLTYYLDGREITPQELAGKSGRVTIRFDYENHAQAEADINGRKETVFVPFTVISGMVLDENFRNVRVNRGRVLSDGNRIIAAGFAVPGLKESLHVTEDDFEEDMDFPDYVEVTADVEDFSLEMTVTVASAGLMSGSGLSQSLDFEEMDSSMDEMTDAMGQLKNGGGELAGGLDTLKDSMGSFSAGADSLAAGIHAYTDGAAKLADGIRTLHESSGALASGAGTLQASAETIRNGVQKLDETLHAQMTGKEKAAIEKQASRAIEAQFAAGTKAYQKIYDAAVQNFEQTMTNEASVQSVQAGIQQGMQAQGLTSDGVVAALAQYYAEHGFTDASGQRYTPESCQSLVPGTETTYAAYFANAVLNGGLSSSLAAGITGGMAEKGAASAGESVVQACKEAAQQAGAAAAVSGAESAKKQIAGAIEAADSAGGHSLVSGTKALSEGTKQLAESIPAMRSGIGQLLNGADELAGNNASLKEGAAKLKDGAVQISSGVGKLSNGAQQLSDGLDEFDRKAIQKMADAYHGDIKELSQRLSAIAQAGESYGTLCGALDEANAVTKLVMRTDAIKLPKEAPEK